MSFDLKIFPAYRSKSVTVTADDPAVRVPLPGGQGVVGGEQVMLTNISTALIYVQSGDSSVVASETEGIPIPSGEKGIYSIGKNDTHISAFCSTAPSDIAVSQGSGV